MKNGLYTNRSDNDLVILFGNEYLWITRGQPVVHIQRSNGANIGNIKRNYGWKDFLIPEEFYLK